MSTHYDEKVRSINIRSIQHYLYCPRRFGLLEINNDWAENAAVVKANLMHERVHSGENLYTKRNAFAKSSVALYNDDLDIYGIADCIEFTKSVDGDFRYKDKNYKVALIEYKPTKPKNTEIRQTDEIQVFAQKLCADKIFGCSCTAYLYYSDVKKRVELPFDSEYQAYYDMLVKLIDEMRALLEQSKIPQRSKGQKCSGCSLNDICIPKSATFCVQKMIAEELKGDL